MVEIAAAWAFADAFALEDDAMDAAREAAHQFGIEPISPATGAAVALVAAAGPAERIIEVGTGTGVASLWLLRGAPEAQLTTIDEDLDHHQVARTILQGRRVRFITGRAADVLPRMNEQAYDLVLVDAGWQSVQAQFATAMRLVRPGGSVLVTRVLQDGKVANPAKRDRATVAYRDLLKQVREDGALAALSIVGDGLLHVVAR